MNLYLVRHPRPDVRDLCYGRLDVAVDPESVEPAASTVRERLGEVLRNARLFSSPATRCVMLARALAARWHRWCAALVGSGPGAGPRSDAVVVTHAGVIRVALRCCGALSEAEFAIAPIEYGSVHRVALEPWMTA